LDKVFHPLCYTTPDVHTPWWLRFHSRSYSNEEFGHRYTVWRDNQAYINHFNANANASYTLAMNAFGDISRDEFSSLYTGFLPKPSTFDRRAYEEAELRAQDEIRQRSIPTSFDWVSEGAVTGVKDQGPCGDCYAFSSTGGIEGAWEIATGQLVSLSEQMILDCAEGTGNLGCSGGNMDTTFAWLIDNYRGGINTESSYPYTGIQGSCRASPSNNGAYIKAYRDVTSGSESDLLAKAAVGPVSVGIAASTSSFAFYSSGVLNDPSCTAAGIDHAVLVVGWGVSPTGGEYWLIKNSWGTCTRLISILHSPSVSSGTHS